MHEEGNDEHDWWTAWALQDGVSPRDRRRMPLVVGLVNSGFEFDPDALSIGVRVGQEAALLNDEAAAAFAANLNTAITEKARAQNRARRDRRGEH